KCSRCPSSDIPTSPPGYHRCVVKTEKRGEGFAPPPRNLTTGSATGRSLPLFVPGLVLLQELGEARVHRDIRVGADACDLHTDEILGHRAKAGIGLGQR